MRYRMRYRSALFLAILLGISIGFAGPQAIAKKRQPTATEQDFMPRPPPNPALALQPNEFTWYADRALPGPVEVVISIGQQRAYAFQAGELIGFATISSGKQGSAIGRFQILEKRRIYHSARYDNAPMPFMMRLNWFGVAMHGGHNPGYPASHGCIRLPVAFAEKLYSTATVGSFVFITDESPSSSDRALEIARANYDASMPDFRLPHGKKEASTYAEADFSNRPVPASYAEQAAAPAPPPPPPRPAKARRSFWQRIGEIF
jgi:L,D-transpeptidase-like protein